MRRCRGRLLLFTQVLCVIILVTIQSSNVLSIVTPDEPPGTSISSRSSAPIDAMTGTSAAGKSEDTSTSSTVSSANSGSKVGISREKRSINKGKASGFNTDGHPGTASLSTASPTHTSHTAQQEHTGSNDDVTKTTSPSSSATETKQTTTGTTAAASKPLHIVEMHIDEGRNMRGAEHFEDDFENIDIPSSLFEIDDMESGGGKRQNYALLDAGATILDSSPETKSPTNLLVPDKDRYMLSPCANPRKWVVISLSEDVHADAIAIANYEKFSSPVKNFIVLGSINYPTETWFVLGNFTATHTNGEQVFQLDSQHHVRYIKLRFLSHYGSEYYCTLSQLKVFGRTFTQVISQLEKSIDADVVLEPSSTRLPTPASTALEGNLAEANKEPKSSPPSDDQDERIDQCSAEKDSVNISIFYDEIQKYQHGLNNGGYCGHAEQDIAKSATAEKERKEYQSDTMAKENDQATGVKTATGNQVSGPSSMSKKTTTASVNGSTIYAPSSTEDEAAGTVKQQPNTTGANAALPVPSSPLPPTTSTIGVGVSSQGLGRLESLFIRITKKIQALELNQTTLARQMEEFYAQHKAAIQNLQTKKDSFNEQLKEIRTLLMDMKNDVSKDLSDHEQTLRQYGYLLEEVRRENIALWNEMLIVREVITTMKAGILCAIILSAFIISFYLLRLLVRCVAKCKERADLREWFWRLEMDASSATGATATCDNSQPEKSGVSAGILRVNRKQQFGSSWDDSAIERKTMLSDMVDGPYKHRRHRGKKARTTSLTYSPTLQRIVKSTMQRRPSATDSTSSSDVNFDDLDDSQVLAYLEDVDDLTQQDSSTTSATSDVEFRLDLSSRIIPTPLPLSVSSQKAGKVGKTRSASIPPKRAKPRRSSSIASPASRNSSSKEDGIQALTAAVKTLEAKSAVDTEAIALTSAKLEQVTAAKEALQTELTVARKLIEDLEQKVAASEGSSDLFARQLVNVKESYHKKLMVRDEAMAKEKATLIKEKEDELQHQQSLFAKETELWKHQIGSLTKIRLELQTQNERLRLELEECGQQRIQLAERYARLKLERARDHDEIEYLMQSKEQLEQLHDTFNQTQHAIDEEREEWCARLVLLQEQLNGLLMEREDQSWSVEQERQQWHTRQQREKQKLNRFVNSIRMVHTTLRELACEIRSLVKKEMKMTQQMLEQIQHQGFELAIHQNAKEMTLTSKKNRIIQLEAQLKSTVQHSNQLEAALTKATRLQEKKDAKYKSSFQEQKEHLDITLAVRQGLSDELQGKKQQVLELEKRLHTANRENAILATKLKHTKQQLKMMQHTYALELEKYAVRMKTVDKGKRRPSQNNGNRQPAETKEENNDKKISGYEEEFDEAEWYEFVELVAVYEEESQLYASQLRTRFER